MQVLSGIRQLLEASDFDSNNFCLIYYLQTLPYTSKMGFWVDHALHGIVQQLRENHCSLLQPEFIVFALSCIHFFFFWMKRDTETLYAIHRFRGHQNHAKRGPYGNLFSFPLLSAHFVGRQLTCAEFPCGEARVTRNHQKAPKKVNADLRLSVRKPTGELGSRS